VICDGLIGLVWRSARCRGTKNAEQSISSSVALQWSYLGWLPTTEGSFETLKITMHWDLSYLRGPNPSFVEVMRSLGIEVDGDTGATEFFAWIKLLFQKVAALQEVQLTFTYTLPLSSNRPRSPIRTLTFERPACPATQPSFRHEVHEDILTLVKLVMGILHHGYYTPRLPHLPHASADHLV
jgi:hypothetical protein